MLITPATTATTSQTTSVVPNTPTTTSTTSSTSSLSSSSSVSSSSTSTLITTPSTSTTPLSPNTSVAPASSTVPVQGVSTVPAVGGTTLVMPSVTPTIGSVTSASASATQTSAPSGGTSTSVVVGAIAGGLVGVAGLIFVVMFIMRRYRKSDDDDFDDAALRRQSAILIDDDAAFGVGNRGGARPPTMIERHMANGPNTFDAPPPMPSLQQYNNRGGPGMGGYGGGYDDYPQGYPQAQAPGGLTRQPSFSPGQIVSPTSPPPVHGGAYNAYNDPAQLSRQPSSAAAQYDQYGQPVNAGYADLARQPSNAGYPDLNRQNSLGGPPTAHYADMDRSSVTPFQAQQYAEISMQLGNLENPVGLNAVNEDEEPSSGTKDNFDHGDGADPFDPRGQSIDALPNPFGQDEHIVPPSPVYSMNPNASGSSSRDRIVSQPPTLPEINMPVEGAFSPSSYDFPQTPSQHPTPSPLNNGFSAPEAPAAVARPTGGQGPRPLSTHTVYDEADAYGGF
ncbi:hypothetical protein HWV62_2551 [Athelia sp. TMB]|nr:hypothetical protein HWV62_2551 [Athelia sp. TMB]